MKKKDKLTTILCVWIIIGAAVGIYLFVPNEVMDAEKIGIEDFLDVVGSLSNMPNGVIISDSNPYYPLIVTPLTVNYDKDNM